MISLFSGSFAYHYQLCLLNMQKWAEGKKEKIQVKRMQNNCKINSIPTSILFKVPMHNIVILRHFIQKKDQHWKKNRNSEKQVPGQNSLSSNGKVL